jgi:hypothetical protein
MSRAGAIPPGVHIHALLSAPGFRPRHMRILGDEARGYLIAGAADVLAERGEDFWWPTLDEALACAERLGAPRDAWTEITAVQQVQMQ